MLLFFNSIQLETNFILSSYACQLNIFLVASSYKASSFWLIFSLTWEKKILYFLMHQKIKKDTCFSLSHDYPDFIYLSYALTRVKFKNTPINSHTIPTFVYLPLYTSISSFFFLLLQSKLLLLNFYLRNCLWEDFTIPVCSEFSSLFCPASSYTKQPLFRILYLLDTQLLKKLSFIYIIPYHLII